MLKPTLVILAAGMGSRYGGLKQMEPVDEYGNLIIDYSIFDALEAGFEKVVCIIKKSIEQDFFDVIGNRIKNKTELLVAYQELNMLPEGFSLPIERVKPWGTAHALMCCKEVLNGPFAVINADDYYGKSAFATIYNYLACPHKKGEYAMVGYLIENTLSDYGAVSRGVCTVGKDGCLSSIEECSGIEKHGNGGAFLHNDRLVEIPPGTVVSMNMWGFDEGIITELEARFPEFLQECKYNTQLKCEYLLPSEVQMLLSSKKASVFVLKSADQWYGITYREDMPFVKEAIRSLKAQNAYPKKLWS